MLWGVASIIPSQCLNGENENTFAKNKQIIVIWVMEIDRKSGRCMHTIHKYPCLSKAQREERNLCSRVKRHQKLKSNLCSILHFAFPKLSFNSIMLIYTETLIILRWNVIYSPFWIYSWKFQRKRYVDEAIKMLQMSKSFNFSHGFLLVLSSHKVLLNLKTCLAGQ